MAWIESHQALVNHPKVIKLSKAAGWSVAETVGKLHIFWWWCLDYATDGRLEKHGDEVIASVFGVVTDCDKFVASLIELKFLDSAPEIRVHDWWDYAGRFLQIRYKRKPKIWKEIKRFYGHSVQRINNRTTTEQQPINNHKPNQPNLTNLTKPNQPDRVRARESDDEFLARLGMEECYRGIDIQREWGKALQWCLKNHRQRTHKFFVNWLNKADPSTAPVKAFDLDAWAKEEVPA